MPPPRPMLSTRLSLYSDNRYIPRHQTKHKVLVRAMNTPHACARRRVAARMLLSAVRRAPRSTPAALLSRLQHTLTELPEDWRVLSTHAP